MEEEEKMAEKKWNERFHLKCMKEGETFIQFLLDAGLDVNSWNKYGKTMLGYAAEWGDLEIIEFLVKNGADGHVANDSGSKPLHYAARRGRTDIVKFFLDRGMAADSRGNNNCTALHYAARSGISGRNCYQEIVHVLFDRNADLDALDAEGRTPLLVAAMRSRKNIAELLMKLGARVDFCCDGNRWTALHYFCLNGWSGTVRSVLEGRLDFDLNARTYNNMTPLFIAMDNSDKELSELLIESGANVCDEDRWTALHHCCWKGWLDAVRCLVNKGCDLNAKNDLGRTPLIVAAEYSHCNVVEYLVEAGADLEGRDENGSTVLHLACKGGWLAVVRSLIEKGSDLNAQNSKRKTPLHVAPHNEIMEHLLKAGANWDLEDGFGSTAFNQFIQDSYCHYLEDITLFIESGAYFNSIDYNAVIRKPLLKEMILQNTKLCTQAMINQFNNADLPKLYGIPGVSERLPSIEKLKIKMASHINVVQHIEETVNYEIQTKGYCDILNARPIVLSILCLESLFKYYNT